MDIKYILIEDFMSHNRSEIDCSQFQSVLIVGQSDSNPRISNGIGKSVKIFRLTKISIYPTGIVQKP